MEIIPQAFNAEFDIYELSCNLAYTLSYRNSADFMRWEAVFW